MYIGKTPIVGNFQKCDALTASATADYTLQVSSTNVVPESANHMLVSLNGILQAPITSFTVSGSTLSFASALTSSDSIDFVILLGNVLDIGTPSDATVTSAKLSGALVTPSTVEPSGDTSSGDNAAIGYTAAEGLILTGQGSTSDVTIKNDADTTVLSIATGTGNVGIGTTSPSADLHITKDEATPYIRLTRTTSATSDWSIFAASDQLYFRDEAAADNRMIIDSSGYLLIGGTDATPYSQTTGTGNTVLRPNRFFISSDGDCGNMNRIGSDGAVYSFNRSGTGVGSITVTSSSTAYNTSSDYRLKENVVEIEDATARLKELKPKRFNFIANADTTVDGFLAHEVSSVVPEAISGTHNETETKQKVVINSDDLVIAENIEQADWETGKIADDNGNTKYPTDSTWEATKVVPVYQGIDQAKLVPLLVKTIQELEARITTLENK